MNCALCGMDREPRVKLLGLSICGLCMREISSIPVAARAYDHYKDIVRIALQKYIHERVEINPVK